MAGPVRTLARLQYRFLDAMRSRNAFEVAKLPPTGDDFAGFRDARQMLLVTYRRSGEPMPSPVNVGVGDDRTLYLRTDPHTGKVKRIRNDPRVVVVPCGLFGDPLGQAVAGRARILTGDEVPPADDVIKGNFTRPMALLEAGLEAGAHRFGIGMIHIEITPAPPPTD
ncbi:MAG: PPOX class F420-dependent oxidoreductase [Micromonosporaceae bacterium]